jgi:NDP-sugar pyrophosphorylase family protein
MKRYIYKENGCKISRAASIGDRCVLGKGCVIEGTAVLQRTIVGRDCVVGSGARVTESHLWAGNTLYCLFIYLLIYLFCLFL